MRCGGPNYTACMVQSEVKKARWVVALCAAAVLLAGLAGGAQPIDDHGNEPTPFSATFIPADNFRLEGQLEREGDVDCFWFFAAVGTTYTLSVPDADPGLDPLLLLVDRNGLTVLKLDDQGGQDALASIEWEPFFDGFYFACVRNAVAGSGSGAYTFEIHSDVAGAPQSLPTPPNNEGEPTEPPTQPPDEEQAPPAAPPANPEPPEDQRPAGPVAAAGRLAVLGADDAASLADVRDVLAQTGAFDEIVAIDVSRETPSAETLSGFEAALVWADSGFFNASLLGDRLADAVDGGLGLVVAAVSFDAPSPFDPDALEGRFLAEGYYVIQPGADNVDTGRQKLGRVLVPDHPALRGVDAIDGGPRSFHSPTTELISGGQALALWDGGSVLIAAKQVGSARRIDVNLFPPSGRVDAGLWPFRPDNDVPQLLSNALLWAAGRL